MTPKGRGQNMDRDVCKSSWHFGKFVIVAPVTLNENLTIFLTSTETIITWRMWKTFISRKTTCYTLSSHQIRFFLCFAFSRCCIASSLFFIYIHSVSTQAAYGCSYILVEHTKLAQHNRYHTCTRLFPWLCHGHVCNLSPRLGRTASPASNSWWPSNTSAHGSRSIDMLSLLLPYSTRVATMMIKPDIF